MPKYEVHLDDTQAEILTALSQMRGVTAADLLRSFAEDALEKHKGEVLSDEFKRLVEESITENEPVLRRFAR